jgi:hypothetical protein
VNKSSGNRFHRTRWVIWALCLLPLAAVADQPAGKSDADPSDSTIAPETNPGTNDAAGRTPHGRDPTDEQWRDASKFLNQYSPKRMALLSQLPDPAKQRLKSIMYGRYLALMKMQESFKADPQLYQIGLQRFTIEDNLFVIRRQFLATPNGPAKAALRNGLRLQVKALFENVQEDRQSRITRMKSWVVDLQTKHDADERNRESVIDQQLKEVIRVGPNALERDSRLRRSNGSATPEPSSDGSPPGEVFQPTTNPQ